MKKLDKKQIIENFQKFVYEQNLTLENIAGNLGMTPPAISRILNGDTSSPHPRTLYRIEKYLKENGVGIYEQ